MSALAIIIYRFMLKWIVPIVFANVFHKERSSSDQQRTRAYRFGDGYRSLTNNTSQQIEYAVKNAFAPYGTTDPALQEKRRKETERMRAKRQAEDNARFYERRAKELQGTYEGYRFENRAKVEKEKARKL